MTPRRDARRPGCARAAPGPAREAQRDRRRDDARVDRGGRAARAPTTACASSCSKARATTSAAAPTSSPATRRPRRGRRRASRAGSIQRRLPDPGAPPDPVAVQRAGPRGVQGAGLGGGHRLPDRARGRLHDRGRRRALLGAVRRARLHARQRRHVVVAPPRRRGARPRAAAARARAQRPGSGRLGRDPPRGAGRRARRRGRRRRRRSSRHGPTVALGLTKWLLHAGATAELHAQLANEAFALELSSRTDDFREGMAAFREKRAPRFEGR